MEAGARVGPEPDRTDAVAARMDELVGLLARERTRSRTGPRGRADSLLPPVQGGPLEGEAEGEAGGGGDSRQLLGASILEAIVPLVAGEFQAPLNETCAAFDISTPLRIAHFLAQTAHESARYTVLVENLNYGAGGLLVTWPSRFDEAMAAAYERQPERIANYVYADRMGNGPEASGDGWRFRGRGILQLTGRATYRAVGEFLLVDLEAEPDLLITPRYAALAAGWYWQARGINTLCDRDDGVAVTEAVNGGRHGLQHRLELLALAKAVLQRVTSA